MDKYVIAKYIRLSMDEAVSESASIPTQHYTLDRHIEALDIPNATVLDFVDNGFTGTSMERPAMQKMLELVRCGEINCIIVKDFSRFSRDAMESGYYIEQVFPLYGVRFIAATDGFDSGDSADGTGGMDVTFKFLMHEYYSKDLSMKVKSAKHTRMRNGEHIVAGAIYGYRKNGSGQWEPDPEPAAVVRQIFRYALDGLSTAQIRDKLFEAKHLAPREYSRLQQGKELDHQYQWNTRAIHRTLTNEQYTGSYVAGKHESTRIGGKGQWDIDRSEWIIIPDKHPALVSKEDFALVQEMLRRPKELAPNKPVPSKHSELHRLRHSGANRKPSFAPYGYTKLSNGEWEIDEVAAEVVQSIFNMMLNGLSARDISDRLSELGYPSPSEYFSLKKGQNIAPSNRWPTLRITEIIKNETYTGALITGRTYQDANGRKIHAPRSEWIITPDRHPVIISHDLFDSVQKAYHQNKRKNMRRREYLLSGKAYCGNCGLALSYSDVTDNHKYSCHRVACGKMKVNARELEAAVMSTIRKQAEVVLESDTLVELRAADADEKRVSECEQRIRENVEQQQAYYEKFLEGEIDQTTYATLKAECIVQHNALKNRLLLYRQKEKDAQTAQKIAELAEDSLCGMSTPKAIVDALIERIHVFSDNKLEIQWKFANFAIGI